VPRWHGVNVAEAAAVWGSRGRGRGGGRVSRRESVVNTGEWRETFRGDVWALIFQFFRWPQKMEKIICYF
jgi:hypothetical protein